MTEILTEAASAELPVSVINGHADDDSIDAMTPDQMNGLEPESVGAASQDVNDDDDDDDDDDNVTITINQDKIAETKSSYQSIGFAKINNDTANDSSISLAASVGPSQSKPLSQSTPQISKSSGGWNIREFDNAGVINGTAVADFTPDAFGEDRPWRKPGADITDYFNYGFSEDTWIAYCGRQKRIRCGESMTGLPAPMTQLSGGLVGNVSTAAVSTTYKGIPTIASTAQVDSSAPRELSISVMTHDKRVPKVDNPVVPIPTDFSVPPPTLLPPPPSMGMLNVPPPTFRHQSGSTASHLVELTNGGTEPVVSMAHDMGPPGVDMPPPPPVPPGGAQLPFDPSQPPPILAHGDDSGRRHRSHDDDLRHSLTRRSGRDDRDYNDDRGSSRRRRHGSREDGHHHSSTSSSHRSSSSKRDDHDSNSSSGGRSTRSSSSRKSSRREHRHSRSRSPVRHSSSRRRYSRSPPSSSRHDRKDRDESSSISSSNKRRKRDGSSDRESARHKAVRKTEKSPDKCDKDSDLTNKSAGGGGDVEPSANGQNEVPADAASD